MPAHTQSMRRTLMLCIMLCVFVMFFETIFFSVGVLIPHNHEKLLKGMTTEASCGWHVALCQVVRPDE